MVGSDSQLQLHDALTASRSGPIDQALRIAAGMSISDIHNVLEDGVAISDPELCNHFITEWLRRLGPFERLAAAVAVSHLYSTHLVELPHAEDSSLAEILLTAKEVLDHINTELSDYHALAESPDTSFDTEFTQSMEEDVSQVLDAAARQLQGTRDELLRLIRQSSGSEMG